jgi:hypothetical protein
MDDRWYILHTSEPRGSAEKTVRLIIVWQQSNVIKRFFTQILRGNCVRESHYLGSKSVNLTSVQLFYVDSSHDLVFHSTQGAQSTRRLAHGPERSFS